MISEKKNFLFIHVPKAAGNSIAERLTKYCLVDQQTVGPFKNPETYFVENRFGLRRHASVYKWLRALGDELFLKMFKFAILRNPWDRLLAHYIFKKKRAKEFEGLELEGFDQAKYRFWLENYAVSLDELCYLGEEEIKLLPATKLAPAYHIDYFLRWERLAEDWETVCRLIDIPCQPLEHRNKGSHTSYRLYYCAETYQSVARLCAREIEHFSWRF
jgi:hypothetical protein